VSANNSSDPLELAYSFPANGSTNCRHGRNSASLDGAGVTCAMRNALFVLSHILGVVTSKWMIYIILICL
jgi:hypothetical protein